MTSPAPPAATDTLGIVPDLPLVAGHVVLDELRLDRCARDDGALCVWAATSVVDGSVWTLTVARNVVIEHHLVPAVSTHGRGSDLPFRDALQRVEREAIGSRGVLAVQQARVLSTIVGPRLAVLRRGVPGHGLRAQGDGDVVASRDELRRRLVMAGQLLLALHDTGLFHGAVSATSVVVMDDGSVWLDLFGLPTMVEVAQTEPSAMVHALAEAYAAPEVRVGSGIGAWSDVYAFSRLVSNVLGADMPPALDALVKRGLAPAITERPVDLSELLACLEYQGGASERVTAGPAEPRSAFAERVLSSAVWVGGLLMLLMLSSAAAFWWWNPRWLDGSFGAPAPTASTPGRASQAAPSAQAEAVMPGGAETRVPLDATAFAEDASALVPFVESAPMRGGRTPLLTLVLFGDLTCPHTQATLAMLPRAETKYGDSIRTVFLTFPLPGRPGAAEVAETAVLLRLRLGNESFWRFAQDLAAQPEQGTWSRDKLLEYTRRLGLPRELLDQAWEPGGGKSPGEVQRIVHVGRRLGVRSTPVLFLNGKRLDGQPTWEQLKKWADDEFESARKVLEGGASRPHLYSLRVWANVATREGDRNPK